MRLTDLEKDVLVDFFLSWQIATEDRVSALDEVEVLDRDVAGSGFFIKLGRHQCLKVGPDSMSYTGEGAEARINKNRIQAGFLFYFEQGYITAFEGFTYGELWPEKIEYYEVGRDRGESCNE